MQYTTNLNMAKPEASDVINSTSRVAYNSNFDTLDTMVKSHDTNVAKLIADNFYVAGDVWTPSASYTTTGYVTSGGKKFFANITLPKSLADITAVHYKDLEVTLIQNGHILHGTSSFVPFEDITNYKGCTISIVDNRTIRLLIEVNTADTNTNNNDAVVFAFANGSLAIEEL